MCVCEFVCVSACGGFEPHKVRGRKAEPKLVGRQAAAAIIARLAASLEEEKEGCVSLVLTNRETMVFRGVDILV